MKMRNPRHALQQTWRSTPRWAVASLAAGVLVASLWMGFHHRPGTNVGQPGDRALVDWRLDGLPSALPLFGPIVPARLLERSYADARALITRETGIRIPRQVPDYHVQLILRNSIEKGIPLPIYVRLIHLESRFDSSAVNRSSGTFGYMQLSPRTFESIATVLNLRGGRTVSNNLSVGAALLRRQFDYWTRHGVTDPLKAWEMALACYRLGDQSPRLASEVPEPARDFVDYVMSNLSPAAAEGSPATLLDEPALAGLGGRTWAPLALGPVTSTGPWDSLPVAGQLDAPRPSQRELIVPPRPRRARR